MWPWLLQCLLVFNYTLQAFRAHFDSQLTFCCLSTKTEWKQLSLRESTLFSKTCGQNRVPLLHTTNKKKANTQTIWNFPEFIKPNPISFSPLLYIYIYILYIFIYIYIYFFSFILKTRKQWWKNTAEKTKRNVSPMSMSCACSFATYVPISVFSNTVKVYGSDVNCGALSLTSSMVMRTSASQ